MNAQERQVIDSLIDRVQRAAAQAGPRDPEAEAFIQQRLQRFPAAPYYMAQTMVAQERALQQAEQRIGELEQQVRGGSTFAGPTASRFQSQPGFAQGGGAGGFLAGAGQMALGIGGGILLADAAMSLLGGGGFGFGGGDEATFERGYEAGQQDDGDDGGQAFNDDGGNWDDGGGGGDDGGGDVGGDW